MLSAASAVAAAAPRPGTGTGPSALLGGSQSTGAGVMSALALQQGQALGSTAPPVRLARGKTLQDLVAQVAGPDERLDPELEGLLLDLADDFVEQAASFACAYAKHRRSATLDVKDVQLYLEKHCQMRIPGFTIPDSLAANTPAVAGTGGAVGAPAATLGTVTGLQIRNARKGSLYGVGEAHRKRLALIERLRAKEAKRAAAASNAPAAAASSAGAGAADAGGAAGASGDAKAGGAAAAAAQSKKRKRGPEADDGKE